MSQVQTRHQLRLHSSTENLDSQGNLATIDSKMASQSTVSGGRAKQATKVSQQTTQQGLTGKKDLPKGSPNVKAKVTEIETLSKIEHGVGSSILSEGITAGGGSPVRPALPPPPPPPPPPSTVNTGTGAFSPLDVQGKYDTASLVVAINAIYGMIHTSQTEIVAKLDDKFSSLKSQIDTLDQRFAQQDQVIREITSGSISRSDLQGVESKINSVAAQADSRFEEFSSELESMKSTLEFFKVDNIRLKRRLTDLEEKASLGEIKSRRFFLTIDGLLENKAKDQRTLVLEKLNADAKVNLSEGEISSAKRVGKITKFRKNRPLSITVRDEDA